MATQLQKLIEALRGGGQQMPQSPPQMPPQQPQQPQQQAPGLMQARQAYTQYATEVQTQGGQPVPFEQFVQGAR